MDAMKNQTALDNFFTVLKSILDENELTNLDKSITLMNQVDHRSPCLLTRKGQKSQVLFQWQKFQITVVGCINAIGQALPPFIVFGAKNIRIQWTKGEVLGTTYGLSDSGWMDNILIREWF